MATNKKSFLLYCDLLHTVSKMPKDKAGELFIHILEYVNDKNPVTDDLIIQLTFEPIKQNLKRDLEKYESIRNRNSVNARLRWDKNNATASECIPNDTKNAVNDNDSVNDNDNVNDINKQAHEHFAKKLFDAKDELDAIEVSTRKKPTSDTLKRFNANLVNQNKHHNHYSEYKKHFISWLTKQPETTLVEPKQRKKL